MTFTVSPFIPRRLCCLLRPTRLRDGINRLDDAKFKTLPALAFLAVGAPVVFHAEPQFVLWGVFLSTTQTASFEALDSIRVRTFSWTLRLASPSSTCGTLFSGSSSIRSNEIANATGLQLQGLDLRTPPTQCLHPSRCTL